MYNILNKKFTLIFVSFCSAIITSIYGYFTYLKIVVLENEIATQKIIISNLNKTNEILQTQLNTSNKNLVLIDQIIKHESVWIIASIGILVLLCYFLSGKNININRNLEGDHAHQLQQLMISKSDNCKQQILDAINNSGNSLNIPVEPGNTLNLPVEIDENIDNISSSILDFST